MTSEIENITLICDIVHLLLGYQEIDLFKSQKQKIYYNLIHEISKIEQDFSMTVIKLTLKHNIK